MSIFFINLPDNNCISITYKTNNVFFSPDLLTFTLNIFLNKIFEGFFKYSLCI